ncbi:MAG: hypothetical protein HC849_22010 [Oscillatoriales cyanobacterium RU_3_3]|nr:hypothetical protein [Microcoleus sp. SU_5_6]NJL67569.1 hypothetical protein [Microcoleus sp. SM1_3_4]NJM62271.1 hypothetical protein [Oscillatoriales cyanobacterium RU_3_3]NJR23262.1 hypothetical protein [Richelia sp. CSU_2_1]
MKSEIFRSQIGIDRAVSIFKLMPENSVGICIELSGISIARIYSTFDRS